MYSSTIIRFYFTLLESVAPSLQSRYQYTEKYVIPRSSNNEYSESLRACILGGVSFHI